MKMHQSFNVYNYRNTSNLMPLYLSWVSRNNTLLPSPQTHLSFFLIVATSVLVVFVFLCETVPMCVCVYPFVYKRCRF